LSGRGTILEDCVSLRALGPIEAPLSEAPKETKGKEAKKPPPPKGKKGAPPPEPEVLEPAAPPPEPEPTFEWFAIAGAPTPPLGGVRAEARLVFGGAGGALLLAGPAEVAQVTYALNTYSRIPGTQPEGNEQRIPPGAP